MKLFSFILVAVLLSACEEDTLRMEKRTKYLADSIFQKQYQFILREQDSICTLRKQANMQLVLDSVVRIRRQEIIKLQNGL